MYRKTLFVALLCCLYVPVCLQAQTTQRKMAQYAISFEPNCLLEGGLRINLEKKLRSIDRLEVNLTGYYLPYRDMQSADNYLFSMWWDGGGYSTLNTDFEKRISGLSGLGIGTTYKHYFFRRFMISTAFSYTLYNVQYANYDFYQYTEDGLNFYDYLWMNTHQPFHKLTTHVALGARTTFVRTLFAEPYIGLGFAYSFYDENKRHYDETMLGYGYRGYYLAAGIKLGFNIR